MAAADWERGGATALRAAKVVFGTSSDVRPLAELQPITVPDEWSAARLIPRLVGNALHFRANYGRALAAWCAVCAVRHPIGALWLILIGTVSFYALLVRRGVVHVSLPGSKGPPMTLMYPQLHLLLAAISALAIVLVGRLSFLTATLFPPALLATAHALLREPPPRNEVDRLASELSVELRTALRGDDEAVHADELETGAAEDEPPARSEELARRVEQIRAKYRPPPPSNRCGKRD